MKTKLINSPLKLIIMGCMSLGLIGGGYMNGYEPAKEYDCPVRLVGEQFVGDTCSDGNRSTIQDTVQPNCNCLGVSSTCGNGICEEQSNENTESCKSDCGFGVQSTIEDVVSITINEIEGGTEGQYGERIREGTLSSDSTVQVSNILMKWNLGGTITGEIPLGDVINNVVFSDPTTGTIFPHSTDQFDIQGQGAHFNSFSFSGSQQVAIDIVIPEFAKELHEGSPISLSIQTIKGSSDAGEILESFDDTTIGITYIIPSARNGSNDGELQVVLDDLFGTGSNTNTGSVSSTGTDDQLLIDTLDNLFGTGSTNTGSIVTTTTTTTVVGTPLSELTLEERFMVSCDGEAIISVAGTGQDMAGISLEIIEANISGQAVVIGSSLNIVGGSQCDSGNVEILLSDSEGNFREHNLEQIGLCDACGGGNGGLQECKPILCAAPPSGCYYSGAKKTNEAGCQTSCGELICKQVCPEPLCKNPEPGCRFDGPYETSTGCRTCGTYVCEDQDIEGDQGTTSCGQPGYTGLDAPGKPCNDGNPETTNDRYNKECTCLGEPVIVLPSFCGDGQCSLLEKESFECPQDCGGLDGGMIPTDCKVSAWNPLHGCENGQQVFERNIIAKPTNGGNSCPKLTKIETCERAPSRNPCKNHECKEGYTCIAPDDRPRCVEKKSECNASNYYGCNEGEICEQVDNSGCCAEGKCMGGDLGGSDICDYYYDLNDGYQAHYCEEYGCCDTFNSVDKECGYPDPYTDEAYQKYLCCFNTKNHGPDIACQKDALCCGNVPEIEEICNGVDDNFNGIVDEGCETHDCNNNGIIDSRFEQCDDGNNNIYDGCHHCQVTPPLFENCTEGERKECGGGGYGSSNNRCTTTSYKVCTNGNRGGCGEEQEVSCVDKCPIVPEEIAKEGCEYINPDYDTLGCLVDQGDLLCPNTDIDGDGIDDSADLCPIEGNSCRENEAFNYSAGCCEITTCPNESSTELCEETGGMFLGAPMCGCICEEGNIFNPLYGCYPTPDGELYKSLLQKGQTADEFNTKLLAWNPERQPEKLELMLIFALDKYMDGLSLEKVNWIIGRVEKLSDSVWRQFGMDKNFVAYGVRQLLEMQGSEGEGGNLGGGGGGGVVLPDTKDDCPDGDNTYSYYDGLCDLGTLVIQHNDSDQEVLFEENVLGGEDSDFVAAFTFEAFDEDIYIEDLQLIVGGNTDNFVNAIDSVSLYKEDKATLLYTETVSSSTILFNNLNYIIQKNKKETIYVKVKANPIGKNEVGKQAGPFNFSAQLIQGDVIGVSSSNEVIFDGGKWSTGPSPHFYTVPVSISNISFVDESLSGRNLKDTVLTVGESVVGIIRISTDNFSKNTTDTGGDIDLSLDLLTLDTNVSPTTTVSSYSIHKAGGIDGPITGTIGENSVTFNVSGELLYDFTLDPGETADYIIEVSVEKIEGMNMEGGDDFVQVEFNNLQSGQVIFGSSNTDIQGYDLINNPRIGINELSNEKVTD